MLVCIGQAFAYDFVVDGIYYNKVGNDVEVTSEAWNIISYFGSVAIPATVTYDGVTYSVTSIGSGAFHYCSGLTSVTIPNSVTSIGPNAFSGCSGLTSITIPNSVTFMGGDVFRDCTSLTSINIPNSVTELGDNAFYECRGLTSVTIGNSVSEIGSSTFYNCSNLVSVTIGNSVLRMGTYAFSGCSSLKTVYAQSIVPPSYPTYFHNNVYDNATLYVPNKSNALLRYFGNELWGKFFNIEEFDMSKLEDLTPDTDLPQVESVTLTDGTPYTRDEKCMVVTLSYTRNFSNTNWQALYVPFQMSYEDWQADFDVAAINMFHQYDDDEDGVFDRTLLEVRHVKSGTLKANHPYLIRAKSTGSKTITLHNAALYRAVENELTCSSTEINYTFTGTYAGVSGTDMFTNDYYSMGGGTLHRAASSDNNLVPFRWYLKMESRDGQIITPPASVRVKVFGDDDEVESISTADMQAAPALIHSIDGRTARTGQKGVFIMNGKKILR